MNTKLDYLLCTTPPWISIGLVVREAKAAYLSIGYREDGRDVCVRRLRGRKMQTRDALMNEFGAAYQFFEEFGENWNALRECLNYLDEWLPAQAYVMVIEKAEAVLRDEDALQMVALLKTLQICGEWWSKPIDDNPPFNRPALPFHVLMNVSDDSPAEVDRLSSLAADAGVPVRL